MCVVTLDRSCLCLVSGLCLVTQANNLQTNHAKRDASARLWLVWLAFASMNRERVTQVTLGFAIMSKETIAARINPGSKEGEPQLMARLALLSFDLFHGVDRAHGITRF